MGSRNFRTFVAKTGHIDLDEGISSKIGYGLKADDINPELMGSTPEVPDDLFDDEDESCLETGDPDADEPEDFTPECYDEYLTASKVLLPRGGEASKATVVFRKQDHEGRPIGKRHANPFLPVCMKLNFQMGQQRLFLQTLLLRISCPRLMTRDRVIRSCVRLLITNHKGKRHPRITTRGWELQVEWDDGSATWAPLKDLKQSNPVEVAEYAVANKIAEEPAFAWWVRDALCKQDQIIKKVKARYWAKEHKFGIELPKTVEKAL